MYKFGETSRNRLMTCDPRLQAVCNDLLAFMDVTVLEGARGEGRQAELFDKGLTKVEYPNSKHNQTPSLAVDIAPYDPTAPGGVDWKDAARFGYMAGLFRALAAKRGYRVRWGGDWDSDGNVKDHEFKDYPHFEIVGD